MESVFDWSAPILAAATNMLQRFLEYLPQLLGAVALMVFGWFIARFIKMLTLKLAQSFDYLSGAIGIDKSATSNQIKESLISILSNIVFWLVILFFLAVATNLLGLTLFSGWLDRLIGHLPNILSGALIIFAGLVFGNLVNDAISTAAQTVPSRQRMLMARGGQMFTVATMIVIGIDQIGIDITVLITVIAVSVGALLGGLAIAFSLGSRALVSNLIGVRYLNKDYRIGETIRVAGVEGAIIEITPVAVILETSNGRVTIPAKIFNEETSLLVQRRNTNA